ncbi:MAG TPA: hypothetical protein PK479_05460 [Novosphingobium sp.]|nr:hypothetical protein [Novosphingobium sp.]
MVLAAARLQTVVCVRDLSLAEQFYALTLGLPIRARLPGALLLDVTGSDLRVVQVEQTTPSQHTVIGFAVPDLDAALAALAGRGLEPERFAIFNHAANGVIVAPDGSRVAWLRDPDSNLLSVVELAAQG